jgi:hypothetical protein
VLSIVGHTHSYIPLATVTEQGDIIYASGAGAVAALAHHATPGYLLATGGHAANPSWVAPYAHPTTDGNVHIPATGASANLLQYASAGTAKWIAMSGDVTIADAGATTIAAGAVDLAMMANIATLKIIGRATAETGVPEAITCTAAGFALLDDANAAAQLTTLGAIGAALGTAHGDLLYFSAAATPAVLAHGTDDQVLQCHADGTIAWVTLGTMAFLTATDYMAKALLTEQGDIIYASAASTPAALPHGTAGQVLQSGGDAANPSWLTLGTMAAATATDYIAKAVGTAHGDLLYFSASATPAVLAHGVDTQILTAHSDGTLTWENPSAGHTQNTDTGTTSATFILDSDHATEDQRITLKNNAGVLELKNHSDDAYMDLKVKDLTVFGTTTTIESTTTTFHDNILLIDEDAATAAATAGVQVERGSTGADASLLWLEAGPWWTAGIVGSELRLARTYAVDVGDGAAESIDVVHNLGTRDVVVQLHLAASTYDAVITDWLAKDINTVTLTFAVHPSASQYRCVVTG